MIDREKVIETLESILNADTYDCWLSRGERKSVCDAVDLLKEQETHWISVKDRMPDSKWVDYLVATELCDGTIGLNVAWLYDDDGGWASTDGAIREGREVVTHWMPLPEHPKESRRRG